MPAIDTRAGPPRGDVLSCPRCGAAIAVTAPWMRQMKRCPRCRAYAQVTVRLTPPGAGGPAGAPFHDAAWRERPPRPMPGRVGARSPSSAALASSALER
jgi:hypothetical protein